MSEFDYDKIYQHAENLKQERFKRNMDAFLNSGTPEENECIQKAMFGDRVNDFKKQDESKSNSFSEPPVYETEDRQWHFHKCPNCQKTLKFKAAAGEVIVRCGNCQKKIKFTLR